MPCIEEISELEKLRLKMGDKVNFVSITFDNAKKVGEFFKRKPFGFVNIADARDLTDKIDMGIYPTNIFLDKAGKVVHIENSISLDDKPDNSENAAKESFESILQKML